jgi:hypothetical protein
MNTVFTPKAVSSMVEKGAVKRITLGEFINSGYDEAFFFRFPSPDPANEANGDGDWLEIEDYAHDFQCLWTSRGSIDLPDGRNTVIYAR